MVWLRHQKELSTLLFLSLWRQQCTTTRSSNPSEGNRRWIALSPWKPKRSLFELNRPIVDERGCCTRAFSHCDDNSPELWKETRQRRSYLPIKSFVQRKSKRPLPIMTRSCCVIVVDTIISGKKSSSSSVSKIPTCQTFVFRPLESSNSLWIFVMKVQQHLPWSARELFFLAM